MLSIIIKGELILSKRKLAIRNRRRGKAYQTKVAKMFDGMNVGTLGGEDVMHEYFSIEAKTQKAFVGEDLLLKTEQHIKTVDVLKDFRPLVIIRHPPNTFSNEPLTNIGMLFYKDFVSFQDNKFFSSIHTKKRFKGYTFYKQAANNSPTNRIPLVMVHIIGRRHKRDIVIMSVNDIDGLKHWFRSK